MNVGVVGDGVLLVGECMLAIMCVLDGRGNEARSVVKNGISISLIHYLHKKKNPINVEARGVIQNRSSHT